MVAWELELSEAQGWGVRLRSSPQGTVREVSITRVRGVDCSFGNGAGRFMAPLMIVNPHSKLN